MSYILDALRRAQAERGRGSVPGLHTPATPVAGPNMQGPAPARGLPWLGIAALAGAGAVAGVWWLWRSPPVTVAAVAPAPTMPVPVAVPAPVPQQPPPTASAPAHAPVAEPALVAAPAPAPTPTSPRAAQVEAPSPPARAGRSAPAPAPAPAVATRTLAPRAVQPASPSPQESTGTVFALADLPAAVREQLPTLQLAGVTYSANPLYRMVIVNGQVLHEGNTAAPGLVLERIEPTRTVWAFRGYRYALPTQ